MAVFMPTFIIIQMKSSIAKSIASEQQKIRASFKDASSPYHYLSYHSFLQYFKPEESNFKQQNLNIIDVHLRYRWWVREQMAFYKWVPILAMTPLLYRSYYLVLVVPWGFTKLFDHYFERFFLWRHRNEKIINMRYQFVTKLSKERSKARRIALWQSLQQEFKPKNTQKVQYILTRIEGPLKYIKFGEFTQYIFHALVDGKQQSSILQTTFYEDYLAIRNILWELSSPSTFFGYFKQMIQDFRQFKKDANKGKYLLDLNPLVDRPDVKDVQIYTLEDNIDHNVRRWRQLVGWIFRGNLQPSTFKLWQYTNLSNYKDIFEPLRYNAKDNWADLSLYYFVLGVPKLMKVIFKRR